ncbi:MAG TPA: serine/threonine-protein kinase [Verrucomicrobiota bacterium]|nr:serine/threonine-protein kinase [Verrucomicrobiota bacterium]
MNPSRPPDMRLRAQEVFFEALDQSDAAARACFVVSACGADLGLRDRVQSLLDDHFSEDGFMSTPAGGELPFSASEEAIGARIGRYRLARKLGEGGMGVVYLAEQLEPVRRQVALKIIKLGMDTRQVVARFEAERQALAMMDHPNIAKILDAGATGEAGSQISNFKSQIPGGRPYFVMEFVPGVPITEFCQKRQSSLEECLRLFIAVCQAIQHAHQKGIIHRDLKPSNILVTLHDDQPTPKVIDFGVAKAISQRLTDKTLFTNVTSMIGTPTYMSPEQAEGSGLDIDTRSDIYSLGVLLYELLTGSPPFPEKRLRSVPHREMQRILLEEEPERPSIRLRRPSLSSLFPLLSPLTWTGS